MILLALPVDKAGYQKGLSRTMEDSPPLAVEFLTASFKIHSPSQTKRKLLDYAFTEYTQAMGWLVSWCRDNLDSIKADGVYRLIDKKTGEIRSEKYNERSISSVIPKPSEIQADLASATKEALTSNVASMIASYLELEKIPGQETGFPIVRDPSSQGWPNALEEFCSNGIDSRISPICCFSASKPSGV